MAWAGIYCILVVLSKSDCYPELCNSQRQVMGNGEGNNMLYQKFSSFRGHHSISGGRGAEVFVVEKLFISTRLGGAQHFSKFYHMFIMFI